MLRPERLWKMPIDPWWKRDEEEARRWTESPAEWETVPLSLRFTEICSRF